MIINLVLSPENKGWIIEKFGNRLSENLKKSGHEVFLGDEILPHVDVTHFLSYNFVEQSYGYRTAMVTHIDDVLKIRHLKNLLEKNFVDKLVCMSKSTVEHLVKNGLPRESLTYVLPAVDDLPPKKQIRIGLSGRIYKDGRKNELWLRNLAKGMTLENFEFHIFGSGWDEVTNWLISSKAKVKTYAETSNYSTDHALILENLPHLDYWMYLGFDEGSMGSLDAALAGVPLIVTPQGFHLDLVFTKNLWVESSDQLLQIMNNLSSEKPNDLDYRYWTWERYSEDHLDIWNKSEPKREGFNLPIADLAPKSMLRKVGFRRILSYLGRKPAGLFLRRIIRG